MEGSSAGLPSAPQPHEAIVWKAKATVHKFEGAWTPAQITEGKAEVALYDITHGDGNLLTYGGASALWDLLLGGGAVTAFNAANAHLGVGDSSTATTLGMTNLQAATNKLRKPMDGGWPAHTDGVTAGAENCQFRTTFGTTDAVWAWEEWGTFNHVSAGRMLNRKAESLGTKPSGVTWTLTIDLQLTNLP